MVLLLLLTLMLSASCVSNVRVEVYRSLKIKCRSFMYPVTVNCFWSLSPPLYDTTHVEYIPTYRIGQADSAETKICLQETPSSSSCVLDEIVQLSKEPHVLNVTAIHAEGVTTTLFPFVPEDIIKPNPPVIAYVRPVSENLLQVTWNSPSSWPFPDRFPLKYNLRYSCCESNCAKQVGPTEDTTLIIKAVYPKGKYCIQVNAQYYLGYGEPSEWSPTAVFSVTPDI